ncbi:MAG: ABC transporter ATP-binding protein [Anaerolineales bacterium]|jgi:ABC-2 type transport system ATP-binding protein
MDTKFDNANTQTVLETNELHKDFAKLHAVNGVNLSIKTGEIYGLIGPNGSGKTTLIRLFLGLLLPTSGTVQLLGKTIPNKVILSKVGYMTQSSALYEELTVRENITFFAHMCGSYEPTWIDETIALVDLKDRSHSFVRTLSGGMRQRTSLACALAHRPRLLLLDEPTVGVDPQLRITFWSYFHRLANAGVTLIISSHMMEEAERCNRLGFMRKGKLLAEGSPAELRTWKGARSLEEAFIAFAESEEGSTA